MRVAAHRYCRRMSIVDSPPRRLKLSSIHAFARARPASRKCSRKSQSALSLLDTPSFVITLSAATLCTRTRFSRSLQISTAVGKVGDEADRPHLAHQGGVEADLVDAVMDFDGRAR